MDLLAYLIGRLLELFMLIVFVNVLLSWIVFSIQNSTVRRVYWFTSQIVDPVLQPIRDIMQPISRNIGIDFSPMVLLFLLYFLNGLLS